jgi:DHA1 family multidrug resistance protein-like MFS transporter
MLELIRDTTLGHFLRIVSRQKFLQYAEDRDPSLWERYVDKEKSGNMAHHGHVGPSDEQDEMKEGDETNGDSSTNNTSQQNEQRHVSTLTNTGLPSSRNSSDTRVDSQDIEQYNEVSGVRVDPEKGRDITIVTWYSGTDPEVSLPICS